MGKATCFFVTGFLLTGIIIPSIMLPNYINEKKKLDKLSKDTFMKTTMSFQPPTSVECSSILKPTKVYQAPPLPIPANFSKCLCTGIVFYESYTFVYQLTCGIPIFSQNRTINVTGYYSQSNNSNWSFNPSLQTNKYNEDANSYLIIFIISLCISTLFLTSICVLCCRHIPTKF